MPGTLLGSRTMRWALGAAALAALGVGCAGCGTAAPQAATTTRPAGDHPALPGTGRPLVTIGDKNFTEQFVLGELYAEALEARGYSVVVNRDIGPPEVSLQALQSGRISMYPEYLTTWNSVIAADKRQFHSAAAALVAARRYARAHALALLRPTPFSNTGAIAVTSTYAAANGLRTLRDLRKVAPGLTMGAPPQFEQSSPGLAELEQSYGFVPAAFKPLAIGAQYQALDQGVVQAADVSTTDAQLRSGRYFLLRDPRHTFGSGQVVPVVPERVLLSEGPAFAATIDTVSALLTLGTVRELNAAVDVFGQDPTLVATRFLQAHGLLARPAG
jgi:osmoprotectant transport system substrate-binding protein